MIPRFFLVGIFCVALNALLFEVLVNRLGWNYLFVTVIAFFLVNAIGFYLNRIITFRRPPGNVGFQAFRYYAVQSMALACNLGLMFLLVGLLRLDPVLSSFVISLLFAAMSFLTHRYWTFRAVTP